MMLLNVHLIQSLALRIHSFSWKLSTKRVCKLNVKRKTQKMMLAFPFGGNSFMARELS